MEDLIDSGVEFLLTDLDVALTFMDIAEVSSIEERVNRNRERARHAYDTVLRLLRGVKPNPAQRQALDRKLTLLRTRLNAVGYQF